MARTNKAVYTPLGASNHSLGDREVNDYYATEPKAADLLMDVETFSPMVWKCACKELNEKTDAIVKKNEVLNRTYIF